MFLCVADTAGALAEPKEAGAQTNGAVEAKAEPKDAESQKQGKTGGWFDSAMFFDPEDGQFDVSNWLASRYGFLPIPIIITGPTLGAGGGLNLMFLSGKLVGTKAPDGRHVPPNITGIAAAMTENGSRLAGAYNLGFWQGDRWRTTTFLGRPDLNLNFYPSLLGRDLSVEVNLEGWGFYQEVMRRLGQSDFLLGANFTYGQVSASPNNDAYPRADALLTGDYTVGGLGAALEYDSRDNIFTPTRGAYAKLAATSYASWLGSDDDFMSLRGKIYKYMRLSENFDLGMRLEGQSVGSNAPFFLYPSVQIRGIADKRYQGQNVVAGELELNWRVYERWHLIGFVGTGKAFGQNKLRSDVSFADAPWRSSKGVGFRYEIARKFGIQVGADVAWGPEETAFYVTMGSAWNAFY